MDTSVPHPARRYNYWLGGREHFAADRESGDAIGAAFPAVVELARANRAFLRRAVRVLAEAGLRQFLDIGSGLPAPDNTHQVAQRVAPQSRVVYVDNDPIVRAHAGALLAGDPRGRSVYFEADVRDPGVILRHPVLRDTLDLAQPVALLLVAVLHFLHDDEQTAGVVSELLAALPSGSCLVLSHGTMDFSTAAGVVAYEKMFAAGGTDVRARPRATIAGYFSGLRILAPGIVAVSDWRADDAVTDRPVSADLGIYGAVGRKP